jgi:endonuclease/exonuclease/phosphatase (EEP) superfamily protein YafD
LTLILAHPPNPIHPTSAVIRDQQIKEIALHVSQIKGEVIVCGDFNASPWSPIMSRFTRQSGLRDSRLGFGAQPTWPAHLPGLRTPIDYCFVSRGIGVQNFRRGMSFGSDHLPIIADLAIPLSR